MRRFSFHRERGAGLEVHAAAEGVDGFVGGLALDDFECLEHQAPVKAVMRVLRFCALKEDMPPPSMVIELVPAPMPRTLIDLDDFIAGVAERDAGEADRELGRVHVGQVDELVHRSDVLQVVGVALLGERGGGAFLLAGDLEGIEDEDAAAHFEIAHGGFARGDVDDGLLAFETGVGDEEFVGAGGGRRDGSGRCCDEGADFEDGNFRTPGTDEAVAGGLAGDVTDDGAGGGRRRAIGGAGGGQKGRGERQDRAESGLDKSSRQRADARQGCWVLGHGQEGRGWRQLCRRGGAQAGRGYFQASKWGADGARLAEFTSPPMAGREKAAGRVPACRGGAFYRPAPGRSKSSRGFRDGDVGGLAQEFDF